MTHLFLDYSWVPFQSTVGGIEVFMDEFVRYLVTHWRGPITVNCLAAELDASVPPEIGQVMFAHICSAKRGLVPVNLMFLLAQIRRLLCHPPGGGIVFLNRTDHAWPYLLDRKTSICLQVHGSAENLAKRNESKIKALAPLLPLLERFSIARSKVVLFVNRSGADYYRRLYPRYAPRFHVVPSAVDTSIFRLSNPSVARRAVGVPSDAFLVLFVGRFEEVKDPILWVNTFKHVFLNNHRARCAFIGSGSLEGEMKKLLSCYSLSETVVNFGPAPNSFLSTWYNAADVVLLTSHFEGSPRVAAEALACGTPVVAPDVGDLSDDPVDGVPLTVCRGRDPLILADAVLAYSNYQRHPSAAFVAKRSKEVVFRKIADHLAALRHE